MLRNDDQLRTLREVTTRAHAESNEEKRETQFKVAKEKCDFLTGNDKDVCEKEAEAKYKH